MNCAVASCAPPAADVVLQQVAPHEWPLMGPSICGLSLASRCSRRPEVGCAPKTDGARSLSAIASGMAAGALTCAPSDTVSARPGGLSWRSLDGITCPAKERRCPTYSSWCSSLHCSSSRRCFSLTSRIESPLFGRDQRRPRLALRSWRGRRPNCTRLAYRSSTRRRHRANSIKMCLDYRPEGGDCAPSTRRVAPLTQRTKASQEFEIRAVGLRARRDLAPEVEAEGVVGLQINRWKTASIDLAGKIPASPYSPTPSPTAKGGRSGLV